MKRILASVFVIIIIMASMTGCAQLKSLFSKGNTPISQTDPANPSSTEEIVSSKEQETTTKKSTVDPLVPATREQPTTEEPTTVEPTTVEPTTEEPTTEEPTTEEPTTEEPTTEEPTTEKPSESTDKTVHELAMEVIRGKWSNGKERKRLLENAGYSYKAVQTEVNRILGYPEQEVDID